MIGIWKQFGDVIANKAINLHFRSGEVHALLGENGAGKTTIMKILSGYYKPDAGSILLNGEKIEFSSPADAMRVGIGIVHQHFHLLETMTAAENIHLGWDKTPWLVSDQKLADRMKIISSNYGVQIDPNAKVWQLSVGEQQRIETLRVLARGAKLLILDEPTAVLTPKEADELFIVMRSLATKGCIVIFISHKLNEVLKVSDRITVLRKGQFIKTFQTRESTTNALAQAMIGYELISRLSRNKTSKDEIAIELKDVHAINDRDLATLKGINLQLWKGEILGIAGVAGNGQSELAEVITGLRKVISGHIMVNGKDCTNDSPAKMAEEGIGHIPEDRYKTGLVLDLSITENAIMRNYMLPPFSKVGFLRMEAAENYTRKLVSENDIRISSIQDPVKNLSGGNQQKLLASREIKTATLMMVAVHPTRGLDIVATENLRQLLMNYRNCGGGVLLISEDLDELLLMSDRIIVLYEGQIMCEFNEFQFDRDRIGLAMGGNIKE
jgi:ABC-type uncharacterized transport system ATPase subunit